MIISPVVGVGDSTTRRGHPFLYEQANNRASVPRCLHPRCRWVRCGASGRRPLRCARRGTPPRWHAYGVTEGVFICFCLSRSAPALYPWREGLAKEKQSGGLFFRAVEPKARSAGGEARVTSCATMRLRVGRSAEAPLATRRCT